MDGAYSVPGISPDRTPPQSESEQDETTHDRDHRYGEKRPPYVAGYFEAFNRPNVSLVDLRDTPIVRVTETGIEWLTDYPRDLASLIVG